MKKKILVVTDVYNWIGHTRAKYLQKYLSDEFIIHIKDGNEFNKWERNTDTSVFNINEVIEYSKKYKKEYISFDYFKKFSLNKKQKRDYDLYYFLFHTMLVKQSVKRLLNTNCKIATVITGYPVIKNIFYKENYEKSKNFFLSLANKCVAVGSNNIKSLEELRSIYNGRTFYAPRGVDPEVFYPMTTEFKRKNESEFKIAYVGKPVPEKGLLNFIKPACEQAGVKLIINDRNYENALSPSKMNEFYNKVDAYVVASTIDGTPNPALEAAACGKPIISNKIGNMPEFIKDGWNGFILSDENMNVNKYAQKLRWMKINQKKTFEMGINARDTILKKWTWEKSIENKRKIFRELLNG